MVDGAPQTAIQLHTRDGVITFGETWPLSDQEPVVRAINRRLEALGQAVAVENDTMVPMSAEIVESRSGGRSRRGWDRDSWDD